MLSSFRPLLLRFLIGSVAVLLVAVVFLPQARAASKFKTLYSFKGGNDGASPSGALLFDSAGNIYGTTFSGGINSNCTLNGTGCGTVFQLTPNQSGKWNKSSLYSFQNGADGANPNGSMVFDSAGNLYGTTYIGGEGIAYGCGTVFKLAPGSGGWSESVAYTFCSLRGDADGSFPNPGMVQDGSGNLYGTTLSGGLQLGGVAFELTPGNGGLTTNVLFSFCLVGNCGSNGSNPVAGLVFDAAGNLYGTTTQGGNYNHSCGGFPGGCGVVFQLKHDSHDTWSQNVIYAFQGPEGAQPGAKLTFDKQGNLYGTTSTDGAFGFGTTFKLTPTAHGHWKYSVLYNFRVGFQGSSLNSGLLIDAAGNLYGAIGAGGIGDCSGAGCGLVYKLTPGKNGRWTFTALHRFRGAHDGGQPNGDLIFDSKGNLYGTVGMGGVGGAGGVFEITP
jgi:uncharacterized repeat protein (TIGR03803 family)